MAKDFRTRLRQPATIAVPDPNQSAIPEDTGVNPIGNVTQPAFVVPDPNAPVTLDSLVNLSKQGASVPMPMARAMTERERTALLASQSPSSKLTPMERNTLTKLGWQDGEPIPPTFSTELQNTFSHYVAQKQAEGLPIEKIKISNIEDLPPAEQERLKAVMRSMIESTKTQQAITQTAPDAQQLAAYPESVRQAMAGTDPTGQFFSDIDPMAAVRQFATSQQATTPQPSVETVRAVTTTAQPTTVVTQPPAGTIRMETTTVPAPESVPTGSLISVCRTCGHDPYQEKQNLTCSHCLCDPLEDPDLIPISTDDKRRFLLALGTKRPFEKEYTVFNETIQVRFRSLNMEEQERLELWAVKTVAKDRVYSPQEMRPRVQHQILLGSLLLQTVKLQCLLEGSDLFWVSPEKPYPLLSDYGVETMDDLLKMFLEEVPSEALVVALQQQMVQFNQLDYRMSRESRNTANFWKGT